MIMTVFKLRKFFDLDTNFHFSSIYINEKFKERKSCNLPCGYKLKDICITYLEIRTIYR